MGIERAFVEYERVKYCPYCGREVEEVEWGGRKTKRCKNKEEKCFFRLEKNGKDGKEGIREGKWYH